MLPIAVCGRRGSGDQPHCTGGQAARGLSPGAFPDVGRPGAGNGTDKLPGDHSLPAAAVGRGLRETFVRRYVCQLCSNSGCGCIYVRHGMEIARRLLDGLWAKNIAALAVCLGCLRPYGQYYLAAKKSV